MAVYGATGAVGQKLLSRLNGHPMFEVAQVVASASRVGDRFGDTVEWREIGTVPEQLADLIFTDTQPANGIRMAFSALGASVAREVEPMLASAGIIVVSNASAFRLDDDVPLIIPELNPEHLELLPRQRKERGWTGALVTNPNCSTCVLAPVLAALHREFPISRVVVATLQAASGAGLPGVPSLDLIDNAIPYIAGEEEKIASETRLLLGESISGRVGPADIEVNAMVHRVAVSDGHLVSAVVEFGNAPGIDDAIATLERFRGNELVAGLPSSPEHPIEVDPRLDRPQPRLDRDRGNGMTITVGRVREAGANRIAFTALGHNLVRGAAGAALQNGELLMAVGLV